MTEPTDTNRPASAAGETAVNPPLAGAPAAPQPAPAAATAAAMEEDWPPDRRLVWGLVAVLLWLLLFAAGILIPSEASREKLGWKPKAEQQQEVLAKLQQQISALQAVAAKDPAKTPAPAPAATDTKATPQEPADAKKPVATGGFWAFLVATFAFTPLNIGFLCILAAFIGGCSVNKEEIWQLRADLSALQPDEALVKGTSLRRRLNYLTEHPGYSAIRGMVVYLILISGLFIVGGDPLGDASNQLDSLTQYMRLAGLFSFFGYLAGYDPTVFSSLINLGSSRLRTTQPDPPAKC